MTPKSDLMDPLPVEMIGNRRVLVDSARPVAVVTEADGDIHFVTWPDAELPPLGATASVTSAPNGLWVVYTEVDVVTAINPPRTTAVFIAEDLSVASVNIGELTDIGADAEGLWCTSDPYPKVERPADELDFSTEDIPLDDDAPIEDSEDLRGPPDPLFSRVPDEGADDFDGHFEWTATRGIGFSRLDSGEELTNEARRLPTPPEPVATGPVILHRYRPDGLVDLLEVDRLVSEVEVVDGRLRLTYHPTGPIERLSADRMSGSFSYPIESIDLDVSNGLPARVKVSEFQATPQGKGFPEEWLEDYMDDLQDEELARKSQRPIDLSAVRGSRWHLATDEPADAQSQVDAVFDQLNGLGEPVAMWTRADDKWHRVRSDYRDLSVEIVGTWPDTEVVAEFRYAPQGDRRFRFRVPVFNAAGRPCVHRYFTTDLEGELDTADFDEVETTDDGFIEV
jgi:hypothetical protein